MTYAGLALLADRATQDYVHHLSVRIVGPQAAAQSVVALLPAHVSLKQPFRCEDLAAVERWFDDLALRIQAVPIALDLLTYGEFNGQSIVGLRVVETPQLRALHEQINAELVDVVADPSAPFDGDAYRFHLTVEMGPAGPDNPYRAFVEGLPDRTVDVRFVADRLALFVCEADAPRAGTFRLQRSATLQAPDGGRSA